MEIHSFINSLVTSSLETRSNKILRPVPSQWGLMCLIKITRYRRVVEKIHVSAEEISFVNCESKDAPPRKDASYMFFSRSHLAKGRQIKYQILIED